MKFYEFRQNNSGGSFNVDNNVAHMVLIEANDYGEAITIAESLGIYFDGVEDGMDCECCGDRWSRPWYAMEFPYRYGAFNKKDAESIQEKYDAEMVETTRQRPYGDNKYDVLFETPESYLSYMADKYGWTSPDGYIYYKGREKVEINGENKKHHN
jgi:hypothetical protein